MIGIRSFQGEDGSLYDVPADQVPEFMAQAPKARPVQAFRDAAGALYDVPEDQVPEFLAQAQGVERVRSVRTLGGGTFDVADSERELFWEEFKKNPEFEADREEARARARASAQGPGNVVVEAAKEVGRGIADFAETGVPDVAEMEPGSLAADVQVGLMDIGGAAQRAAAGLTTTPAGNVVDWAARKLGTAGADGSTQFGRWARGVKAVGEEWGRRADELAGKTDMVGRVVRGVNQGAGALGGAGPLYEAAAPVLGMATMPAMGALGASDSGDPEQIATAAAMGLAQQLGLGAVSGLPAAARIPAAGALFGGLTAAEGGSLEDVIAQGVFGAGLAAKGGARDWTQAKDAIRPIVESNWFRKLTIRERGLVAQSLAEQSAGMRKQGMSEGQILRTLKRIYGNENSEFVKAMQARNQGERAPMPSVNPEQAALDARAAGQGLGVAGPAGAGQVVGQGGAGMGPPVAPAAAADVWWKRTGVPWAPESVRVKAPVVPEAAITPPAVMDMAPMAPEAQAPVVTETTPLETMDRAQVREQLEQEASQKLGWPISKGQNVLVTRSAAGKPYNIPIKGKVVEVLGGGMVRMSYAAKGDSSQKFQDISMSRLNEPPAATGLRKRAQELAELPAAERKAVVTAERELKQLMRVNQVFTDPNYERYLDSLTGKERAIEETKYTRWQVENLAKMVGQEVDASNPVQRARLLPAAKEIAGRAGVSEAKFTPPESVDTAFLNDGDMVWADGEWHVVSKDANETQLRDGYVRSFETGEDAMVQGVLRKGDAGYDLAREEYRVQEQENKAQREQDLAEPTEELVPDVTGIEPVPAALTLESQTPEQIAAEQGRIAQQQQTQAQREEIARRSAAGITGTAGDLAQPGLPGVEGAVEENLFNRGTEAGRGTTITDVTPDGFGPGKPEGEAPVRVLERVKGETIDQAVERYVGYQVENGLVKIEETRDGWKARVSGVADGAVVTRSGYDRQQVLNQVFELLYPGAKFGPAPAAAGKAESVGNDALLAALNAQDSGSRRLGTLDYNVSRDGVVTVAHAVTGRELGTINLNDGEVIPARDKDSGALQTVRQHLENEGKRFALQQRMDRARQYPVKNAAEIARINSELSALSQPETAAGKAAELMTPEEFAQSIGVEKPLTGFSPDASLTQMNRMTDGERRDRSRARTDKRIAYQTAEQQWRDAVWNRYAEGKFSIADVYDTEAFYEVAKRINESGFEVPSPFRLSQKSATERNAILNDIERRVRENDRYVFKSSPTAPTTQSARGGARAMADVAGDAAALDIQDIRNRFASGMTLYRGTVPSGPTDEGHFGKGQYWSNRKETATNYGNPVSSTVALNNPYVVRWEDAADIDTTRIFKDHGLRPQQELDAKSVQIREQLESRGYDGVVVVYPNSGELEVVVFEPAQVGMPTPAGGGARAMADVAGDAAAGQRVVPERTAQPANDPRYSILPIELPELVDFARSGVGKYPQVKERLRALHGSALGVYRTLPGTGPVGIELKRSLFKLLHPEDLRAARADAELWANANWVEKVGGPGRDAAMRDWIDNRLTELREKRLTENPMMASDVLAHEIGHWIDDVPNWELSRGNILGHVAALNGYTKKMLAELPPNDEAALPSVKERAALRRQAEKETGKRPAKDEADALKVWKDAATARYGELIAAEARKRGLVTRQQVLDELNPLIAWWHGTEEIPEYFKDPAEMFADAFSVLANNPAAMRQRAPTYYKLWQSWLVQRPEARDLWEKYQVDATLGRVGDERDKRQMAGIAEADRAHEKQLRAKLILSPGQNRDAVMGMLWSSAYPLERRAAVAAKQGRGATSERMRAAIQNERYRHSWSMGYMLEVQDKVGRMVFADAGVPLLEWQTFLQNRHIAENRQGIASMLGMNPAASNEALARQRQRLGETAYNGMVKAQETWHELRKRYVIGLAKEKGLLDQELADLMEARAAYTHVAAVNDAMDPLEAVFNERYGAAVGSQIHKQEGYLGLARDPWQATLEMDRSIITAAYRNELKAATRALLADAGDEMYKPAGTRWDANMQRMVPVTGTGPRASTVTYMAGGKPESFWAPQEIVDFIDNADPASQRVLTALVNTVLRKQKGLFTYLNYGFPMLNTPRDIQDWIRNLPGWKGRITYNRYAGRAKPIVQSIMSGQLTPEAAEVMRSNILLTFPEGLQPGQDRLAQIVGQKIGGRVGRALDNIGPQTALERLTAAYGLNKNWMGLDTTGRERALDAVKQWYMNPTRRGEMTRKVAGWLYLKDQYPNMSETELQRMVQERAGSPDFANRARLNTAIDSFVMFYNPFLRGWQSSAKAFAEEPLRTTLTALRYGVLPKLLMAAIGAGVMKEVLKKAFGEWGEWYGEELRKMEKYVPRYYKENYAVHLLWWDPTDPTHTKVIFETSPLSEANRFASAALWKMINQEGVGSLLDYGADQLPGLNPILVLGKQWGQVLTGETPKGIGITPTQVEAGAAISPMMRETWNVMSGGMIYRIPREGVGDVALSPLEKALRLPIISNTIGRRLRVSNKGYLEALREKAAPREHVYAVVRTQAWDDAYKLVQDGSLTTEASIRYGRGEQILSMKPSKMEVGAYLAMLPETSAADAYYAERVRDYALEIRIGSGDPAMKAMNRPWTERIELLKGFGQ